MTSKDHAIMLTLRARRLLCTVALLVASTPPLMAAEGSVRPPAPSLVPATSAESVPDADGFIRRWFILDPIRCNTSLADDAVKEAVRKEYFPNQLGVIPHDGDKVTVDGEELVWNAVESKQYNVNLYHFAYARSRPTSFVLFWGVTIVNCPEETRGVRLATGSNAASIWWVNGQQVIGIYGDRQTVIDDGVSKRLTLRKGLNVVRCAVLNGGGATDFCARFLDVTGEPFKGFVIRGGVAAR